jgi:hypothetical protein
VSRLTIAALLLALALLLLVFEFLRRRRLREKYAAIWVAVAAGTIVMAVFPNLLYRGAALLGIQTPSNLLFLVSLVVLLSISLQLSGEVGQLEEQTRTLAEEVGSLRLELERLQRRMDEDNQIKRRTTDQ